MVTIYGAQPLEQERSLDLDRVALAGVALVVFVVQLGLALWWNAHGYLWGDAISRSSAALIALFSADPHLAAIGFVWMPLPTLLEIIPTSLYHWWPEVVSSGFASSMVTVLAGTLTAVIVYLTARRFALPIWIASLYSLLVALSPMLLLFSTNGMSEGVAAPFLIGAVCTLLLFWNSGQRRYVALSGLMLGVSFACLYQSVQFGAALTFALALGLYASENMPSAPQGRLRAVEGLSLLFLVPSMYIGVLWVIANAAIVGNPLYFATSQYSNEGYIASTGQDRIADAVVGDPIASLGFVAIRTLPFLIPIFAILLVRLLEGRLFRINTATLLGVVLVVPFGLILLQLYQGSSFGWLRYFMYPLFVAAGWGLYEMGISRRRNLAIALVMAGWVLTIPASVVVMNDPKLGQNEYQVVRSLWTGESAREVGYPLYFDDVKPVAAAIDALGPSDLVLVDSSNAWTVAATVQPATLKHNLLFTSDARFHDALRDPAANGVCYLLVPNPNVAPSDLLNAEYPQLWAGTQPGFELAEDFSMTGTGWRLYRVMGTTTPRPQ